jgi:hypothetical protein
VSYHSLHLFGAPRNVVLRHIIAKEVHARHRSPTRPSTRLVVGYVIINNDLRAGIDTTAAEGYLFSKLSRLASVRNVADTNAPSTARAARSQAQI